MKYFTKEWYTNELLYGKAMYITEADFAEQKKIKYSWISTVKNVNC